MFSPARMCLRKAVVSFNASKCLGFLSEIHTANQRLPNDVASSSSFIQFRSFNSVKFSSKFEYFSASQDLKLPNKIHKLSDALEDHNRPLTLLMTWLMAKDKHISKYIKFYNNLGIDVLNVKFTPLDIMTPKTHGKIVVDQLLYFLHHYPASIPLLIHGFSVGGYPIAAAAIEMENHFEKHGMLVDRFIGQIWDSVVDVGGLPIGVSKSVTSIVPLQKKIQSLLEWYLRFRYDTATIYYDRASVIFHKNFLGTPGLFLVSNADPIAPPSSVLGARDVWKQRGYEVYSKCWDDTTHVAHYRAHPKEYEEHVVKFLKNIGLSLPITSSSVSSIPKISHIDTHKDVAPILT